MRQREDGCVYAYTKGDSSCFAIPCEEHESLLAAWMAGKAFWQGHSFYGGELTLKLGDIAAIAEMTPESLAAGRADKAADEAEDALT